MGRAALALFLLYLAVGFGLRTLVHWRRTGSTGFKGIGDAGGIERAGGLLFVAALALGVAAPVLDLRTALAPVAILDGPVARATGLALFVLGFAGTVLAQFAMGSSWRIGVDPSERTSLVTGGPFAYVRNPIFTAMLLAAAGLLLLVPNLVAIAAFLLLLIAIEIQVRAVEEPHLVRMHGASYVRWARRTGRFLPGIGRLGAGGDDPGAR